jgi:hypothetical protein
MGEIEANLHTLLTSAVIIVQSQRAVCTVSVVIFAECTVATSKTEIYYSSSLKCVTTDWATGVWSPAEANNFSSSLCVQTSSEAHPASCPMDTGIPFAVGKARTGLDADHSPASGAEVKMSMSYTSSPPKHLHDV